MSGLTGTLAKSAEIYHAQIGISLTGHPGFLEYLESRHLHGLHTIQDFKLGYVADPLPGDEQFRGRLAIPYLTPAGVVGMKYRCIEAHSCKDAKHPKYTQPHGQKQHLYNVAAYHSGRNVLGVAEGEICALSATVHLDIPTWGIPGASQWQSEGKYWSLGFRDFDLVVVFADGDEPGKMLAKQIASDAGSRARLVYCDEGQDVNSMIVAGRVDELKKKAGL